MKFELESFNRNVSDEDLLEDIKEVAKRIRKNTVTIDEYEKHGKYHPSTLQRRFKSWFLALEKAGLEMSRSTIGISNDELFQNIKNIWMALERQPKYSEVKSSFSKYSARTYEKRFGSWRKALEAFINYINEENEEVDEIQLYDVSTAICSFDGHNKKTHRTKRNISERLRFRILLRDGFRCKSCGRSPLNSPGVELHVDHILPWSMGGETIPENLETKCKECNLGKGNAFDK